MENTLRTFATKAPSPLQPYPDAPSIKKQAIKIGPPDTAPRLLQPMLFNPSTRTPTGQFSGTLREPPQVEQPQVEPPQVEPVLAPEMLASTEPVVPEIEMDTEPVLKLDPEIVVQDEPIVPVQGAIIEVASKPVAPAVVQPSTKSFTPEKSFTPPTQVVSGDVSPSSLMIDLPIVDRSMTTDFAIRSQFVPAAVIEDAKQFASEVSDELSTQPVSPASRIEVNPREFPVIATAGNSPLRPSPAIDAEKEKLPCASCGHDDCAGCDSSVGEPIYQHTEFANPTMPENTLGDFVPMAIPVAAEFASDSLTVTQPQTHSGPQVALESHRVLPETMDVLATEVASANLVDLKPTPKQTPTGSRVPPLGVETLMELNAVTWQSRLDQAIELVQQNRNQNTDGENGASLEVSLRLLRALRGQMEHLQTANPSGGHMNEKEARYWQHQLEAITAMLEVPLAENQALTDYHRHQSAHQTLNHLRMAVEQLESMANLKIVGGQLCTDIMGFGQYRVFASKTFQPGQKMLVYCEVENYKSSEQTTATGTSFRTKLRGSFAIYDTNGKVVQQSEFPAAEDASRTRRRDFFMYLPVTLGNLPPGDYALHVMVEDINGNKTASLEPGISFSVGGRVAATPQVVR